MKRDAGGHPATSYDGSHLSKDARAALQTASPENAAAIRKVADAKPSPPPTWDDHLRLAKAGPK